MTYFDFYDDEFRYDYDDEFSYGDVPFLNVNVGDFFNRLAEEGDFIDETSNG